MTTRCDIHLIKAIQDSQKRLQKHAKDPSCEVVATVAGGHYAHALEAVEGGNPRAAIEHMRAGDDVLCESQCGAKIKVGLSGLKKSLGRDGYVPKPPPFRECIKTRRRRKT